MSGGESSLRDVAAACAAADTPCGLAAALEAVLNRLGARVAYTYRQAGPTLHVERLTDEEHTTQDLDGDHPLLGSVPPETVVALASASEAGRSVLTGPLGQVLLTPFGATDELLLRLGGPDAPTWLGVGLAATPGPAALDEAAVIRTLLADAYGWVRSRQLDRAFAATAGELLERRGRLVLVADTQGTLRSVDGRTPGAGCGVPPQLLRALELMIARDAAGGLERGTEISMPGDDGQPISATLLPKAAADTTRAVVIDLPRRPTSAEDLGRLGLSGRQAEVLALILSGETTSAVGNQLGISSKTAQKHLEQAYRRLGANSRLEALAQVLEAV